MAGGVREIPLTRGYVTLVDEADLALLQDHRWAVIHTRGAGQRPAKIYARNYRLGYLHRFLLRPGEGLQVDHINGDGLDNRRQNLRLCTPSQNSTNRAVRAGVAGYRGVFLDKGFWRAGIRLDSRTRYLGVFPTALDAAKAYDEAAIRLHGEFARLNFPDAHERAA